MDAARTLFGKALGKRLAWTEGRLEVPGITDRLSIRRDRWGVPHICAATETDAWYGLGFCHAQDRAFQLETLLRVVRGTLSALIGKDGVGIDRMSRRIGFGRNTDKQVAGFAPDIQDNIASYVAGVNAGNTFGSPKKAHEFVLLTSKPTPWTPGDVAGIVRLQSFLFATNADAELSRLKILLADGPEALAAIDPSYSESWQGVLRADAVAPAVDRLAQDLAAFGSFVGAGGASNSWALSGGRTASGRPMLANDPHLPALLPSVWYLAHLTTPEWAVAGATLVGGPAVEVGHNGFAAWGITAALFDNTDLFQEEIGPDGASVRSGDGFVPCEVLREEIKVRYKRSITEKVAITPRGPVVSPAFDQSVGALSMGAFWLAEKPIEGFLRTHRATSFDEFRRFFARWPGPDLNVSYADTTGAIGWQLVGEVPIRKSGWGTVPLPGWEANVGWEDQPVPFDEMPHLAGSDKGFLATANTRPYPGFDKPFLGEDWIDGYRLARITEMLAERSDWDMDTVHALQLDEFSIPWRDMKGTVLAAPTTNRAAKVGLDLLKDWDGRVSAGSPAAAVFEFFVAEMSRRVVAAKSPLSIEWALGRGFGRLLPYTTFAFRRVGHLVELLNQQPKGWFDHSWGYEIAAAVESAVRTLTKLKGESTADWAWGKVRPLELKHPVGDQKPMNKVFNLGPFPKGGDSNTVAQTSVDPIDATHDPAFIASLRFVADVGNWDACEWVLPAGQSGNPMSEHYDDQLPLWREGRGINIAWSEEAVAAATVATLILDPAGP